MPTESEARYRVASAELLERLNQLERLDRYTLADGRRSLVNDTYIDTAGCDLAQQGWACRLRSDESGVTLTLKGPPSHEAAIVNRIELETPLPAASLDPRTWPPGPWRDQALELAGERPLSPWIYITQVRIQRLVNDGDRSVAELSLDTVDLSAIGPRVYIVECERLPDGLLEDLQRITTALTLVADLTPEPRSKLELALAADAERIVPPPDEPARRAKRAAAPRKTSGKAPTPQPDDSIWVGIAKVLERYRRDMLAHEQGTRLGDDPEHLHDMRVATRRLRSAMRLMRPYLRSPHAARVQRGLSALGGALGAVRDLDVALGHLAAFRDQAGTLAAPGLQVLQDDWSAQRDVARKKMLRYLDRKGYRRLLKELDRLLDDLYAPEQCDGEAYRVDRLVPRLIKVHWDSVEAHGQVARGAPQELLHEVRIECKRLRYALESYRSALPKQLTGAIPAIIALQDHLGDMRDTAVAVDRIDRTLSTRGDLRGLEGALHYRAACQARAEELEGTFSPAWQRFQRQAAPGQRALRRLLAPPAPARRWWPPANWLRRAS